MAPTFVSALAGTINSSNSNSSPITPGSSQQTAEAILIGAATSLRISLSSEASSATSVPQGAPGDGHTAILPSLPSAGKLHQAEFTSALVQQLRLLTGPLDAALASALSHAASVVAAAATAIEAFTRASSSSMLPGQPPSAGCASSAGSDAATDGVRSAEAACAVAIENWAAVLRVLGELLLLEADAAAPLSSRQGASLAADVVSNIVACR